MAEGKNGEAVVTDPAEMEWYTRDTGLPECSEERSNGERWRVKGPQDGSPGDGPEPAGVGHRQSSPNVVSASYHSVAAHVLPLRSVLHLLHSDTIASCSSR